MRPQAACRHPHQIIQLFKHKAKGDLLITHWGVSGPATLRLSSSAARTLSECKYQGTLIVNWLGASEEAAASELKEIISASPQKALLNAHPAKLTGRLWEHIIAHGLGDAKEKRWCELGKKEVNKLIQELTAAPYPISGRAPFNPSSIEAHQMVVLSSGKVFFTCSIPSGEARTQATWMCLGVPLVRNAFIPISMLMPVASIGSAMMSVLSVRSGVARYSM